MVNLMYLWASDEWLGGYLRDVTDALQPGLTQAVAVTANYPPGAGGNYV